MFVETPVETCCVCAKNVEASGVPIVEIDETVLKIVETVLELVEPTENIEDCAVHVGGGCRDVDVGPINVVIGDF